MAIKLIVYDYNVSLFKNRPTLSEQYTVMKTEKTDLKLICFYLCLLWGMCIYSDQHAFIVLLSIDKELFLY